MQLFITSIWLERIKGHLKLPFLILLETDMITLYVEVLKVNSIILEIQPEHGMFSLSTKTGSLLMLHSLGTQAFTLEMYLL